MGADCVDLALSGDEAYADGYLAGLACACVFVAPWLLLLTGLTVYMSIYLHMYISISISIYLSMCISIYIHTYMHAYSLKRARTYPRTRHRGCLC